jgi:hypothetical protein
MLGHDVKYSNELDDAKLARVAEREGRVLLTRDLELYQQATANVVHAFYLTGENEEEKLAELAKRFKIQLHIDMTKSRCPKCNGKVRPVSKKEIVDGVERSTFVHYNEFWRCKECGQIYWRGAHWKRIRKTLEKARKILKKT